MPDREPLTGVDNAWRRMGSIDNLTTITGVLWLEESIGYEEVCARLEDRLLRFDRFGQRVGGEKRQLRQPYWESVADFDIETHVQHVALPEPQDKAAFQRFVSGLMSRPLDERRPLWEAYLVEGVGDGCGIAFRINHSIGDGFALLYVLFGLVDDPEGVELPIGIVPDPPSPDAFRDDSVAVEGDGGLAVEEGNDGVEGATAGSDEPGESTAGGSSDADAASTEGDGTGRRIGGTGPLDLLRTVLRTPKIAYELLTQEPEVETSLRGDLGTAKRVSWTDEIDLEAVKAIGREADATVNDVLLAAVSGAFRRLLEERGEDTEGLKLRGSIPVNLKPMSDRTESLGNYFGLVFVPLPVGTRDLEERIRIIRDHLDEERAGIEAYLMYLTIRFGGWAPDVVLEWLMGVFEGRGTGVITNVPGPVEPIEFAGREITDVMFWVPQANDQGIGISIFSYDGSVRLGIAGDANLLPEPDRLAEAFEEELAVLSADVA